MKFIETLQAHPGEYIQVHKETGEYLGSGLDRKKTNGLKVDAWTASTVLAIYEKLSDARKPVLVEMTPIRACEVCLKLANR